jgi:hypothetical protein
MKFSFPLHGKKKGGRKKQVPFSKWRYGYSFAFYALDAKFSDG